MNNLQRAKEEAMEKVRHLRTIQNQTKHYVIREDILDEIVTSTYLQAVEDCEALVENHDPNVRMDRKTSSAYWGTKLSRALQSLKQTKDND